MPCCEKRRKAMRLREARTRSILAANLQVYRSLKDTNPTKLQSKLLLEYHRKTHMLYAGAIKRRPLNKKFINATVELHDRFVKEMLKRGMKHNSPLKKI